MTEKKKTKPRPVMGPASETQRSFLQHEAQFIIYGGGAGSGKSHLALMYSLMFEDDSNFRAVYIRQNSTQLRQAGGLWDTAKKMYKPFNPKFREDMMVATFPSGATVQFKVCATDRDTSNFDGK